MKKFFFSLILCLGTTILHAQELNKLMVPGGTVGDSGNGNVGIGTDTPASLLTIKKTLEGNGAHIQFGNRSAVSGEVSSTMSFAGWGIQHAGFSWVPNTTTGQGKLQLSFGGADNPFLHTKKVTFQSNGNVGIGASAPKNKLEVNGTIKGGGDTKYIKKGGHYYNVLSSYFIGTPTYGMKIKTNIPFLHAGGMHTIDIKGYDYGGGNPIKLTLNFYVYGTSTPNFKKFKVSSSGNLTPDIKLAEEGGKVVIFLDYRGYYVRLGVDAFSVWHSSTLDDEWYNNWAAVDEALSGTHQHVVNVGYYNSFGEVNTSGPLTVAGKIHAREVKVTATAGADFVFDEDYALPSLEEVEAFVKANKHLPEIPSAAEMVKNGINLAEINIKLLQKVEELTLYVIEQQKQAKQAVEKNEELEKRINVADQKVEELNQELQEIKEMIKKKM